MADRPILFSGPMVRAILAGTKTQTRRIVRGVCEPVPGAFKVEMRGPVSWAGNEAAARVEIPKWIACPYGVPGDRLWVRETWADLTDQRSENGVVGAFMHSTIYAADQIEVYGKMDDPERVNREDIRWRPSIFMKRPASRITLDVTAVRVERLQHITDEDIRAEGVDGNAVAELLDGRRGEPHLLDMIAPKPRDLWRIGWDAINGKRASWASNPWVWVVSFKRVEAPSD